MINVFYGYYTGMFYFNFINTWLYVYLKLKITNSIELLKPFQTNLCSVLYTRTIINTMNLNTIIQYEFASSRSKITCAPLHVP